MDKLFEWLQRAKEGQFFFSAMLRVFINCLLWLCGPLEANASLTLA